MNSIGRQIDALAHATIYNGIKLFEEKFPNATDEEFAFFYSCIHKHTGIELYQWAQENFSKPLDKI